MESASRQPLFTSLDWLCRIVVAAVFLLAAVPKLLDPLDFAKAIANYRVMLPFIGQDYVFPVAILLPALEFVAAVALLLNRTRRAGSLVCGVMLAIFIVLITQAVARGLNIDCGCFGIGAVSKALAQKVGVEKIIEDIIWFGMCAFVFARSRSTRLPVGAALHPARV